MNKNHSAISTTTVLNQQEILLLVEYRYRHKAAFITISTCERDPNEHQPRRFFIWTREEGIEQADQGQELE